MINPTSPELQIYSPEVFQNPQGESLAVRFDVKSLLEAKIGPEWQKQIMELVDHEGRLVVRRPTHETCREADVNAQLGLITLDGKIVADYVPGMWELYQGTFKQLMQAALPAGVEPLRAYDDPALALETLSQQPAVEGDPIQRRLEAHVDLRYTAVLVAVAPNLPTEGRLAISNNPNAKTVEEIKDNATYIVHRAGTLVCFSQGRVSPHVTEEIKDPTSRRVITSLNYPTETETPEVAAEIQAHIEGRSV